MWTGCPLPLLFLGGTMSRFLSLLLALLATTSTFAQLDLGIQDEVKPTGQYVTLQPKTEAKAITYIGLSGIDPIPSAFLKDARWFLLDTRGLSKGRYRFAAVGSLDDEHVRVDFSVVVGEPGPAPGPDPPPGPGPGPGPTPTLDALGQKSYDAVKLLPSIAQSKAGAVAAVYRDVIAKAEALTSGYSSISEIQSKLQAVRAEAQGDPASWGGWNSVIKTEWDAAWQNSGGQLTRAQVIAFHKSVASGLEASAVNQRKH